MGKSGALDAACATWGGAGFKRTWNSTANGMEGIAALHNDGILVLDEIGECEPDDVGAIVYSLGNGTGKQRAGRTGAALGVAKWRCIFLSSGEISLETLMNNAGQAVKSGQEMRLLQVPLKQGLHGAWHTLHGASNGADFTENLKREALKHYGHAGRSFLERLTRDRRDFCSALDRIKASSLFSCESGEGQEKRAAARFALVALAGEVASEYGLSGWAVGDAIQAAAHCFKLWQSSRAKGNSEQWQIIRKVAGFIERHGDGRFSARNGLQELPLRDRAGWWEDGEVDGRVYCFTCSGLREALKGMDFERGLDTLQECGALPPAEAGSNVRSKNKKVFGRQIRLYPINPAKLNVTD